MLIKKYKVSLIFAFTIFIYCFNIHPYLAFSQDKDIKQNDIIRAKHHQTVEYWSPDNKFAVRTAGGDASPEYIVHIINNVSKKIYFKCSDDSKCLYIDMYGLVWLPDSSAFVFACGPIYGKPGIYIWNAKRNKFKMIVKSLNKDKDNPEGRDEFELYGVSKDGKTIYYYSYDMDDPEPKREEKYLKSINLEKFK
jgi:hypothetical protein